VDVQVYNRTREPQTFLWWANPAVHANDDYQSIFPPDVHAVMDHGKRDVSAFPIATGTYYKVDYSPAPTSRATRTSPCRRRSWRTTPTTTSSDATTTRRARA
jgi:hypothetical protein